MKEYLKRSVKIILNKIEGSCLSSISPAQSKIHITVDEVCPIASAQRGHLESFNFMVRFINEEENAYNNRNKYSLVCHSVDLHKDIFNCGTESLENKVLLIRKGKSGESSHGGSLFENRYCFALLDWGYLSQGRQRWGIANIGLMGFQSQH